MDCWLLCAGLIYGRRGRFVNHVVGYENVALQLDESMQSMRHDRFELTTSVATWGSFNISMTSAIFFFFFVFFFFFFCFFFFFMSVLYAFDICIPFGAGFKFNSERMVLNLRPALPLEGSFNVPLSLTYFYFFFILLDFFLYFYWLVLYGFNSVHLKVDRYDLTTSVATCRCHFRSSTVTNLIS